MEKSDCKVGMRVKFSYINNLSRIATITNLDCDYVQDGVWIRIDGEDRDGWINAYRLSPVHQGHPHAAIMQEFAEVAAQNPNPESEFEYFSTRHQQWRVCTSIPAFEKNVRYRRKPVYKHKIGNVYSTANNDKYILALVAEQEACLISLDNGNRYRDYVKVNDAYSVSDQEFEIISGGSMFELVTS